MSCFMKCGEPCHAWVGQRAGSRCDLVEFEAEVTSGPYKTSVEENITGFSLTCTIWTPQICAIHSKKTFSMMDFPAVSKVNMCSTYLMSSTKVPYHVVLRTSSSWTMSHSFLATKGNKISGGKGRQ